MATSSRIFATTWALSAGIGNEQAAVLDGRRAVQLHFEDTRRKRVHPKHRVGEKVDRVVHRRLARIERESVGQLGIREDLAQDPAHLPRARGLRRGRDHEERIGHRLAEVRVLVHEIV
jgi:hypothetical protein